MSETYKYSNGVCGLVRRNESDSGQKAVITQLITVILLLLSFSLEVTGNT